MKIVQAHTGATCVPVPAEGVIFVDPKIGHDTAVIAIQAALPSVHPDAVEHWVEEVLPTARPLATHRPFLDVPVARHKVGAHRVNQRPSRFDQVTSLGVKMASLTAASVLGVVVAPMITGQSPVPASAAEAWSNPVFNAVQVGSGWRCDGTDNSDLIASCVAHDGARMHVEAWVGPDSITFTFSYRSPATGKAQRNALKVFSSAKGVENWRATSQENDRRLFPNLVVGERWVLYGTEPERIKTWAEGLGAEVVLPADFTEAAFAMGLLPEPGKGEPANNKELRAVPGVVRDMVKRIIVGDRTLKPAIPLLDPIATVKPLPHPKRIIIPSTGFPPVKPAPVPSAPTPTEPAVEPSPVTSPVIAPTPSSEPVETVPDATEPATSEPAPAPEQTEPAIGRAVVPEPSKSAPDPLTDPIEVPEEELTPTHDELAGEKQADPPIFGQVASELAQQGRVNGHVVVELARAA